MCSNHRKQVWRIYNCSPTLSVLSRRCPLPPALSPAPGAALLVGRALSYTIGEYTCQAQVARYKRAFLKAVLRQDVAWCGGARREDAPALALATPSRREVRYESARPEELSARIADGMAKVEKESQPGPVIITTSHTSQPLIARWRRGLAARSSSSSRASATAWAAWSSG